MKLTQEWRECHSVCLTGQMKPFTTDLRPTGFESQFAVCVKHNRATGSGVNDSPIWHRRPVKPAKQEQVKEGLPVIQSSMHWPLFRHGRRCGHTDAEERTVSQEVQTQKTGRGGRTAISEAGFTRVIAATHFHMCIIYAEHPSARVAHVGGPLNVYHISRARAGDVEIALPIAGIETCLGREQRGGSFRHHILYFTASISTNTVTKYPCDLTCAAIPPSPARFPPLLACMPVVQVMLLYWKMVKDSSSSVMSTTWKVFTCQEKTDSSIKPNNWTSTPCKARPSFSANISPLSSFSINLFPIVITKLTVQMFTL